MPGQQVHFAFGTSGVKAIKYAAIPPEPPRDDGFAVGARITHAAFGLGFITHLDGEHVTILFDKSGSKKVVSGYIKLVDV